MPQFTVRYFDAERNGVSEVVHSARSVEQARLSYEANGKLVLDVRRQGGLNLPIAVALRSRVRFDVATWCRELRTLLVAGMTVVEALETLEEQSAQAEVREVLDRLLQALREGLPLSRAMARQAEFPEILVAGVTASERTSTLAAALDDYLAYEELLARLQRQVVSAAVYPAVVISLGLLVTLFLLIYVMPRFSRMYVDFKGVLSLPTQLLLIASAWITTRWEVLLLALAAVAVGCVWAWQRRLPQAVGRWLIEKIPPIRDAHANFVRATIYHSLALMFRGGYPLDEALSVCAGLALGASQNGGIHKAQMAISRGQSVSAAFAEAGLADVVARRLLAVGERGGHFDHILRVIAERHATAFSTFVERATRLVEPLLLLIVALVVGGIVVMMYMPVFDIASGIR